MGGKGEFVISGNKGEKTYSPIAQRKKQDGMEGSGQDRMGWGDGERRGVNGQDGTGWAGIGVGQDRESRSRER